MRVLLNRAAVPGMNRHRADVFRGSGISHCLVNEPVARGVAGVTEEHPGLQAARREIRSKALDGIGMILRCFEDVDAHVGFVEREERRFSAVVLFHVCLLYTSPSPRDRTRSR